MGDSKPLRITYFYEIPMKLPGKRGSENTFFLCSILEPRRNQAYSRKTDPVHTGWVQLV